jgi:hypothetical protein
MMEAHTTQPKPFRHAPLSTLLCMMQLLCSTTRLIRRPVCTSTQPCQVLKCRRLSADTTINTALLLYSMQQGVPTCS